MPLVLLLTFISGILAILAPCIWPLLPIVLSSSNSESKSKGIGTVLGLVTSFTIFTIAISFLISALAVNTEILRKIAGVILLLLGITFIIPPVTIKVEAFLSRLSSNFPFRPSGTNTQFFGGFGTGLVLGLVWSPCAAPILAIVATISATQTVSFEQILNIFAFAAGLAIPLLILTILGSILFAKTRFLTTHTHQIQQGFGLVIALTAVMILTNYDRQLQKTILDLFPAFNNFLANIESLK